MGHGLGALPIAFAIAIAAAGCPSATTPRVEGAKSSVPAGDGGAPLGEITLQAALEAAWDGDWLLCYKRARTAVSIAPDDLETIELTMRCAHAQRVLPEAVSWVRSAYAKRPRSTVVRYALAVASFLRGEIGESRKAFERIVEESPAAAYHAALAAQLDDDLPAAERAIGRYVKEHPDDPAGHALQAEIVCAADLPRCSAIVDDTRSGDDDATIARRLGTVAAAPISPSRARLAVLSREAEGIGSAAFADHYALASLAREGGDPAGVLVRSPRSGRPEPGSGVDLVKQARAVPRLPFATRVTQLAVLGDPAMVAAHQRLTALFPTELASWRIARREGRLALAARRELERSAFVRWRAVVATTLARPDEFCELSTAFPWTDRGPIANAARARCELSLEPSRGRKIADARLAVSPYGALDVEVAIEGHVVMRDGGALEALGRSVGKLAPAANLPSATALWAAAEVSPKNAWSLFNEAAAQLSWDPSFSRRLLRRYVDQRDVARAKQVLSPALAESPLDPFLCGVQGEILLHEGKLEGALGFLTKSCVSARARKEQEVLASTLSSLAIASARAKDPKLRALRDAAIRCAKGE